MNDTPTPVTPKPLRVLWFSIVLFLVANLLFALINPSVGSLMLFNRGVPGFQRFPLPRSARETGRGDVIFTREVIRDLDVLFPSHVISAGKKAADEYRVVLIGDSSAWGARLAMKQTLTGRINRAGLKSCDNRRVVVYDLGLPGASALKDLMILSEVVENYEPDLVIWSFTMNAFASAKSSPNRIYAGANYERLRALETATGFDWDSDKYKPQGIHPLIDRSLYGRRDELNLLFRLHWFSLKSMSIGTDDPRTMDDNVEFAQETGEEGDGYFGVTSEGSLLEILHPDYIRAARMIAGSVPIIYINQPIFVEDDNPIRYNSMYPRWAYDEYRKILQDISVEQSWIYLDLWSLLPKDQFSDTIFHRTSQGEARLVDVLVPVLQQQACPK